MSFVKKCLRKMKKKCKFFTKCSSTLKAIPKILRRPFLILFNLIRKKKHKSQEEKDLRLINRINFHDYPKYLRNQINRKMSKKDKKDIKDLLRVLNNLKKRKYKDCNADGLFINVKGSYAKVVDFKTIVNIKMKEYNDDKIEQINIELEENIRFESTWNQVEADGKKKKKTKKMNDQMTKLKKAADANIQIDSDILPGEFIYITETDKEENIQERANIDKTFRDYKRTKNKNKLNEKSKLKSYILRENELIESFLKNVEQIKLKSRIHSDFGQEDVMPMPNIIAKAYHRKLNSPAFVKVIVDKRKLSILAKNRADRIAYRHLKEIKFRDMVSNVNDHNSCRPYIHSLLESKGTRLIESDMKNMEILKNMKYDKDIKKKKKKKMQDHTEKLKPQYIAEQLLNKKLRHDVLKREKLTFKLGQKSKHVLNDADLNQQKKRRITSKYFYENFPPAKLTSSDYNSPDKDLSLDEKKSKYAIKRKIMYRPPRNRHVPKWSPTFWKYFNELERNVDFSKVLGRPREVKFKRFDQVRSYNKKTGTIIDDFFVDRNDPDLEFLEGDVTRKDVLSFGKKAPEQVLLDGKNFWMWKDDEMLEYLKDSIKFGVFQEESESNESDLSDGHYERRHWVAEYYNDLKYSWNDFQEDLYCVFRAKAAILRNVPFDKCELPETVFFSPYLEWRRHYAYENDIFKKLIEKIDKFKRKLNRRRKIVKQKRKQQFMLNHKDFLLLSPDCNYPGQEYKPIDSDDSDSLMTKDKFHKVSQTVFDVSGPIMAMNAYSPKNDKKYELFVKKPEYNGFYPKDVGKLLSSQINPKGRNLSMARNFSIRPLRSRGLQPGLYVNLEKFFYFVKGTGFKIGNYKHPYRILTLLKEIWRWIIIRKVILPVQTCKLLLQFIEIRPRYKLAMRFFPRIVETIMELQITSRNQLKGVLSILCDLVSTDLPSSYLFEAFQLKEEIYDVDYVFEGLRKNVMSSIYNSFMKYIEATSNKKLMSIEGIKFIFYMLKNYTYKLWDMVPKLSTLYFEGVFNNLDNIQYTTMIILLKMGIDDPKFIAQYVNIHHYHEPVLNRVRYAAKEQYKFLVKSDITFKEYNPNFLYQGPNGLSMDVKRQVLDQVKHFLYYLFQCKILLRLFLYKGSAFSSKWQIFQLEPGDVNLEEIFHPRREQLLTMRDQLLTDIIIAENSLLKMTNDAPENILSFLNEKRDDLENRVEKLHYFFQKLHEDIAHTANQDYRRVALNRNVTVENLICEIHWLRKHKWKEIVKFRDYVRKRELEEEKAPSGRSGLARKIIRQSLGTESSDIDLENDNFYKSMVTDCYQQYQDKKNVIWKSYIEKYEELTKNPWLPPKTPLYTVPQPQYSPIYQFMGIVSMPISNLYPSGFEAGTVLEGNKIIVPAKNCENKFCQSMRLKPAKTYNPLNVKIDLYQKRKVMKEIRALNWLMAETYAPKWLSTDYRVRRGRDVLPLTKWRSKEQEKTTRRYQHLHNYPTQFTDYSISPFHRSLWQSSSDSSPDTSSMDEDVDNVNIVFERMKKYPLLPPEKVEDVRIRKVGRDNIKGMFQSKKSKTFMIRQEIEWVHWLKSAKQWDYYRVHDKLMLREPNNESAVLHPIKQLWYHKDFVRRWKKSLEGEEKLPPFQRRLMRDYKNHPLNSEILNPKKEVCPDIYIFPSSSIHKKRKTSVYSNSKIPSNVTHFYPSHLLAMASILDNIQKKLKITFSPFAILDKYSPVRDQTWDVVCTNAGHCRISPVPDEIRNFQFLVPIPSTFIKKYLPKYNFLSIRSNQIKVDPLTRWCGSGKYGPSSNFRYSYFNYESLTKELELDIPILRNYTPAIHGKQPPVIRLTNTERHYPNIKFKPISKGKELRFDKNTKYLASNSPSAINKIMKEISNYNVSHLQSDMTGLSQEKYLNRMILSEVDFRSDNNSLPRLVINKKLNQMPEVFEYFTSKNYGATVNNSIEEPQKSISRSPLIPYNDPKNVRENMIKTIQHFYLSGKRNIKENRKKMFPLCSFFSEVNKKINGSIDPSYLVFPPIPPSVCYEPHIEVDEKVELPPPKVKSKKIKVRHYHQRREPLLETYPGRHVYLAEDKTNVDINPSVNFHAIFQLPEDAIFPMELNRPPFPQAIPLNINLSYQIPPFNSLPHLKAAYQLLRLTVPEYVPYFLSNFR